MWEEMEWWNVEGGGDRGFREGGGAVEGRDRDRRGEGAVVWERRGRRGRGNCAKSVSGGKGGVEGLQ